MTADTLIAKYGRSKVYNSNLWELAGGSLTEEKYLHFKELADEMFPNYLDKTTLELPNGDTIDLPHFWATISGQIEGNDVITGWGGDLVQLAGNVAKGTTEAKFPGPGFSKEDWVSDADAHNLKLKGSYVPNLKNYWLTITEKERANQFVSGYDGTILERYNNQPGILEKVALSQLETSESATTESITAVAEKMQEYIDNVKES